MRSDGGFGGLHRRASLRGGASGRGADDSRAREFVGTSFWIFHGGKDSVVPVGRSRSIFHLLKAAGAKAKYTEYPGVDHDSWTKAYREPGLADWLFAQHR